MTSSPPVDANTTFPQLLHSTLIIPCVSMANIPQLAVDLLIHSYRFSLVGLLSHTYLYPFASPKDRLESDPACPGEFATGLQVYYSKEHNLTILQQRLPVISSYLTAHATTVIRPFIDLHQFARVLVLDSSDAGQVARGPKELIHLLGREELVAKSLAHLSLHDSDLSEFTDPTSTSPFSNHCQSIYKPLLDVAALDLSILHTFVYEGDNFGDAEAMACALVKALAITPCPNWLRPVSWKGVYGDRPIPRAMEEGLFG